jgi:GNAT superfamily N-acetyltransferase
MKVLEGDVATTMGYARADPDVVSAWVEGWALSRNVAAPVRAHGGFHVDVGLQDQKARYVFADVSAGVAAVSRAVEEPHVFIKVCAPPEAVVPLLADGWTLQPLGVLMVTDDLHRGDMDLADGYGRKLERARQGHVATIRTQDGQIAASGRAFLSGPTAVFDQIVTHPDHRRRGLGRIVMNALGAAVVRDGATRGCLVATPEGQALYGALGWRSHALVTTAVRE